MKQTAGKEPFIVQRKALVFVGHLACLGQLGPTCHVNTDCKHRKQQQGNFLKRKDRYG